MGKRAALAEDLRRLGLAVIIAAIVGGFLEDQVASTMTVFGFAVGAVLWLAGLWTTEERS